MTPSEVRVAQAYRVLQARLGAQTAARIATLWPLLDIEDLDATFDRWLASVTLVIEAQHVISTDLARNFLEVFKGVALGANAIPAAPAVVVFDRDALTTSMLVTGPLSVKRAMARGVLPDRASGIARASSAAAGMRHALNGGRDTIAATLRNDDQAVGYRRATSAKACDYCSGLSGIFLDTEVAFHAHDGCHCVNVPVYR